MKITIKNKLLLSFTALILLSLITQLIFNLFFADTLYTMYKKHYMENSFYAIQDTYDGNKDTLIELASDMEDMHNIQLLIESDDEILYGTFIAAYEDEFENEDLEDEVESSMDTPRRQGLLPNEPNTSANLPNGNEMFNGGNAEDMLELSGTFEYEGETIFVNMKLPSASLHNSASFFTNSNAIISIFIFILGVIIASRVAKSITKPIEKVEKISSNLANLEFHEYASEDNATREVDSLARSINSMSKELKYRIDELNKVNEKLQQDVEHQMQLEQMRREFVANVSHEMKTPLAILQFYCENLKSDIAGIDKAYYYDTIIEETNRMDEMVKSMLDISSLENGLSKMNVEELDFSQVAEHTVAKLQPLLLKFKVEIQIEPDLIVNGDSRYLEQAIKNYVTNAVSHTVEEGMIQVVLTLEGGLAKFSVYNEGSAIDEAHIERIWESFYKSDKARVREANTNVGLGLYIVKCIIDNHQGRYGVSNVRNGVEFYFEVPII